MEILNNIGSFFFNATVEIIFNPFVKMMTLVVCLMLSFVLFVTYTAKYEETPAPVYENHACLISSVVITDGVLTCTLKTEE